MTEETVKILVTREWKEKYNERIRDEIKKFKNLDNNYRAKVIQAEETEDQRAASEDVEIAVGFPGDFAVKELGKSPDMRWIQILTAGVDKLINHEHADLLRENNVVVTNASGLHGEIMSEHVLGFMLNLSHRFHLFRDQQHEGEWERLEMDYIAGKKLTILGMGAIGREIAVRAKAFDMEVTGVKRDADVELENADILYPPAKMKEAVREADYVVAVLPYTSETEEIIDGEIFSAMPQSSFFINVGRGEIVDEDDLLSALEEDEIAGAGLDVFQEEPLPEDSPFYDLENVILTPHVAGSMPDYYDRSLDLFLANLEKYLLARERVEGLKPGAKPEDKPAAGDAGSGQRDKMAELLKEKLKNVVSFEKGY